MFKPTHKAYTTSRWKSAFCFSGDCLQLLSTIKILKLQPLCAPILLLLVLSIHTAGQEPTSTPSTSRADEVVRIETNLIQAGVTVLDKQGRFVGGLKPEQFEVRVDGKPQTISFFDQVVAGSSEERVRLAAARGVKASGAATPNPVGALPDHGRVVLFFLDDLHMSPESIRRARKMLEHFIESAMGPNDLAAVASASGQLGFLQQLTDNKGVLRVAASRLGPQHLATNDGQIPAMTEYIAKSIVVEGDRDVLETYVLPLMREGIRRPMAETAVKTRAQAIHQAATEVTRNTLRSLHSMIRRLSTLPGRKQVFFISDGFLLNVSDSNTGDMLRNITDAAVRSGFVLYTIDSRGLSTDSWIDAESPLPVGDNSQALFRATRGEMSASQEALYVLAEQTGGRAELNTNAPTKSLSRMLNEAAAYYVLAWQPTAGEQKGGKFRHLEVTVKDRPELIVLVQRGFLEGGSAIAARGNDKQPKPGEELKTALAAVLPVQDLPVRLSLSYLNTQKESALLTALIFVPMDAIANGRSGEINLEVQGYVINLDGKIGSRFGERLSAKAAATSAQEAQRPLLYRHQVNLAPGIYQVRAAAMDVSGKRVGSATGWIEIPDLKSGQLTLGSVLTGERPEETGEAYNAENFVSQRAVDYRFTRDSRLRFMTYVYNSARSTPKALPDLEVQIQVLRDEKPVFTDDWRKIEVAGQDVERIAYGGELGLDTLSPGRYILQLTVNDKAAKAKASGRAVFMIE